MKNLHFSLLAFSIRCLKIVSLIFYIDYTNLQDLNI